MRVRPYTEADADQWDEMTRRSACGTFLHSRRFLSYHGDRFEDVSVCCEDGQGRLTGIFPAARKPDDPACVMSHPGATYGGLVHEQGSAAGDVEAMMGGIVDYYRSKGFLRLEYKSVPPHLHSTFLQADVHALWKTGAELARRDLWNVLSLGGHRPDYSSHHQRAIGRARKSGVTVRVGDSGADYAAFHGILARRLEGRYGVSPVHTPEEMLLLKDRFPRDIALWLAQDGGDARVLAGCWVFKHADRAWHTQYIASTQAGRDRCATHLVFDGLIQEAAASRIGYVSFGSSTEEGGQRLNQGLFDFKAGFGAGAVCHDTYRLRLA